MKKVYKPAILKCMCLSRYCWWGDTEKDRKEIIKYLKTRDPEEAKKRNIKNKCGNVKSVHGIRGF